jgi:hypothetical protein
MSTVDRRWSWPISSSQMTSPPSARDAADPDRVSSFLNIRVADIEAVHAEWSARGAHFLTPPKKHATEIRRYIRDPDGYVIEVGQTTLARGWRPPS